MQRARRRTAIARARAAVETDFRCAAKFTRDDDEHTLAQTTRIDVFNECGDGTVIVRHAEAQRFELMLIHRVIVPVVDATAQRPAQLAGDDFHAGLDQAAREQQLLTPAIATVAVPRVRFFFAEVKGIARLWIGEQRHGLRFKFIQRAKLAFAIKGTLHFVQALAQHDAITQAPCFRIVREADVGHFKVRPVRIIGDGEWRIGITQICGAVVFERWIHADVVRQRVGALAFLRAQVIGHRHPVRQFHLRLVAHVGIT